MKSTPPAPMALDELRELTRGPYAARDYSPLSANKFLLFDAEHAQDLGSADRERIARWLWLLPCPTLAVAPASNALSKSSDVFVTEVEEAELCLENIQHSPLAATILVQLLRATEKLPVTDALIAESLAYATLQGGPEFKRWLKANRHKHKAPAPGPGPAVELEREGGRLALLLNRPENRNSMSMEMRDALVEALQLTVADDSIRSLRVAGRGACFSTGGDLSEFGTAPDPATAHLVRSLSMPGRFLVECMERVEVHARVHGACIGSGVEFPAFAQRVTAADDAFFQLPELRYGLIPGAGGCVSIPRRIGRQRTAWMALSGRRIGVGMALDWGLIDAIADAD